MLIPDEALFYASQCNRTLSKTTVCLIFFYHCEPHRQAGKKDKNATQCYIFHFSVSFCHCGITPATVPALLHELSLSTRTFSPPYKYALLSPICKNLPLDPTFPLTIAHYYSASFYIKSPQKNFNNFSPHFFVNVF